MKSIGEKIRFYRRKKNITIQELAKGCGSSQSNLSEIETGKIKSPSAKIVAAIAEFLEVSTDELLLDNYTESPQKRTMFFRKYENLSEESKKTIAKIVDALDSDD